MDAKAAKEQKSFTAKDAENAKETKSLSTKAAKDAKDSIIRTRTLRQRQGWHAGDAPGHLSAFILYKWACPFVVGEVWRDTLRETVVCPRFTER